MTETDAPLLTASELRVARNRREVLHGVGLTVRQGEIVGLLGPNGAGKSTLLAALGGTLAPSSGTVERLGRIATLMQAPGLAARSARANVELALAWWGVPRPARRARAEAALQRMRAGDLADRFATTLSGGEQRRVHLARAVAVEPDVLLLDEPFDGLDPQTHVELRDDTVDAVRAVGAAAVVVLHDRADAWAVADRLVVLVDGRIQADGSPRALLDAPPTAEVARLLGYDGEMTTAAGLTLTRAANVRLDPAGQMAGRISKIVSTEDGARLAIHVAGGSLWCLDRAVTVRPGDEVRLRIDASVTVRPSESSAEPDMS